MGTVISFPGARRSDESRASEEHHGPATIIILPVIRIERYVDEPKVKALLAIPEDFGTAALLALGWPEKALPKRLRRRPLDEIAFGDRFGAPLC